MVRVVSFDPICGAKIYAILIIKMWPWSVYLKPIAAIRLRPVRVNHKYLVCCGLYVTVQ